MRRVGRGATSHSPWRAGIGRRRAGGREWKRLIVTLARTEIASVIMTNDAVMRCQLTTATVVTQPKTEAQKAEEAAAKAKA